MNKILMSNNLKLQDEEIYLKVATDIIINIKGHVIIKEINPSTNIMYTINMEENSSLDYYRFDNNYNLKVVVNSKSNTMFNYYYSTVTKNLKDIDILNNVIGNNINNKIIVRGVTTNLGILNIKSNAYIADNTINNIFKEDIRVLNLNHSESKIMPYLEVSTSDIEASHNATITGIEPNYLLYLNSKGISNNKAINLIKKGFILNNIKPIVEEVQNEL